VLPSLGRHGTRGAWTTTFSGADALLSLQKRGLRLGQSRVVSQQTASGDNPKCIIWDIKDSN